MGVPKGHERGIRGHVLFLAVLNPEDEAHVRATDLGRRILAPWVTTAWVLTEVADALAGIQSRNLFGEFWESLQRRPKVRIIPPTQALFERGITRYLHRSDKEWSLTDCISFLVMEDEQLREALTGDHHL